MRYAGNEYPWTTMVSFGTIKPDFSSLDVGIFFGTWETGPWMGVKHKSDGSFSWVSMGQNFMLDIQIWRHSCFSVDFDTGELRLFENGEERFKKASNIIKKFGSTMNHVAAGCGYRAVGDTLYPSMYGRITDVQIFNGILSDSKMKEITGCEIRGKGDILNWDFTKWIMSGIKKDIREENLHWENHICESKTKSYHIIPQKMNFIPNGLKHCQKFSAELAMYESEAEFHAITRFIASDHVMEASPCWYKPPNKDRSMITRVWLAGHDTEEEGVWRNYYTGELVSYQPWMENRPYQGGHLYNCIGADTHLINNGGALGEIKNREIGDYECENDLYCPLCSVEEPILKIFVRGLCKESLLDTEYLFNTDRDGELLYLGQKSSMIKYNRARRKWFWYNMKNNRSVVTSSSTFSSLLMGVHTFDFSGLLDDECSEDGEIRKLKFTTCSPGKFTCGDGNCIDIDERCDKIEQCGDKSDEDDCKIVHMKKSYGKTIAPFTFDYEENR